MYSKGVVGLCQQLLIWLSPIVYKFHSSDTICKYLTVVDT